MFVCVCAHACVRPLQTSWPELWALHSSARLTKHVCVFVCVCVYLVSVQRMRRCTILAGRDNVLRSASIGGAEHEPKLFLFSTVPVTVLWFLRIPFLFLLTSRLPFWTNSTLLHSPMKERILCRQWVVENHSPHWFRKRSHFGTGYRKTPPQRRRVYNGYNGEWPSARLFGWSAADWPRPATNISISSERKRKSVVFC